MLINVQVSVVTINLKVDTIEVQTWLNLAAIKLFIRLIVYVYCNMFKSVSKIRWKINLKGEK